MLRLVFALAFVLLFNACTTVKSAIAMQRSTDHFTALESDQRVHYETGAETAALKTALYLDNATHLVEQRQDAPFKEKITIYVCDSIESFADYCVSETPRGCVLNKRLFISPKAVKTETIEAVLTHELSHLHMEQHLGFYRWNTTVPAWFKEGLAVYVSNGAGADSVSALDALHAISIGQHIRPNRNGSLLFPKTASDFDMTPHMFYRQSGLFVTYMHQRDKQAFKGLLRSLREGMAFETAVHQQYAASINELWNAFVYAITQSPLQYLRSSM